MRQTTNGATTNYAIDLAGGLTQALADGTNVYLYGNGRIAQYQGVQAEYFLGDALGSVRQLADGNGNVTLVKRYEPYGELLDGAGSGGTRYGFANEWTDATGLVYLRARYYAPRQGRFTSRDTWQGDYGRPVTFNRWLYVSANPILFVDPSGYDVGCPGKDASSCGWPPIYPPTSTPGSTPTSSPTPVPIVCANPFDEQGNFLEDVFRACRVNPSLLAGLDFISRESWGGANQYSYLEWNNVNGNGVCPPGGPSDKSDACMLFQKPEDLKAVIIHHTTKTDPINYPSHPADLRKGYISNPSDFYDTVDLAFHFLVLNTGAIYEGRPLLLRGSHTGGANTGTVGVELDGDFTIALPSQVQVQSTIALINALKAGYPNIKWITGHYYMGGSECPGEAFRAQFSNLYSEADNNGLIYMASQTGLTFTDTKDSWIK